jgi:acyl-CoA reductase-like NAD-dependent aldehyde dehydrogenase
VSVDVCADLPSLSIPEDMVFVGGDWTPATSGRVIDVESPGTGEAVARVTLAGMSEMAIAVDQARRAFDAGDWSDSDPCERAMFLRRLADAIEARADVFRWLHVLEGGTPIASAVADQASGAVATLRYYADMAATFPWVEHRVGRAASAEVRHAPVGVVAAIVPWNAPLSLAINKIAPALLAGCTVILKPAEETPLHALFLAGLIAALDLPHGVVSVLPADRLVSQALVEMDGVDKVTFTGGTEAGRAIAAICGSQLKRCSLELGGKSAAIIMPDAELDAVLERLAPLTMMNNGQICVNQTRVLAPNARYDDVVERLASTVSAFTVGDPFDPSTDIGPLITAAQRDRVADAVARARAEGARVVTGGGLPGQLSRGWYFEPTVLSTVDPQMGVAQKEIFGPVVSVLAYADEDDAVRIANATPYGLSGTVWGGDDERASALARRIRTGNIGLGTLSLDLVAPFGGFKQSGLGREKGPEGLAAFTELQAIMRPVPPG